MKYLFLILCVLLSTFSYTMDDSSDSLKRSPYMDRFYCDDPNSGTITVFCKTRKNKCIGIITKDQDRSARIIFNANRLFCDISPEGRESFGISPDDEERLLNIVRDESIVRLQNTLTGIEESYKN